MHGRLLIRVIDHTHRRAVLRRVRERHLHITWPRERDVEVLGEQRHDACEIAQSDVRLVVEGLGDLSGGYESARDEEGTSQRHLSQLHLLDGPLRAGALDGEQEEDHSQQTRAARVETALNGLLLLPTGEGETTARLEFVGRVVLLLDGVVVVGHHLRVTHLSSSHLVVRLETGAQLRQLPLHRLHARVLYASLRPAVLTLVQVALEQRLLLLQLADVVHQTLRPTRHAAALRPRHRLLVLLHGLAHGVLHHPLHQRHAVVVPLRARLLQVELLQRGEREVEVALGVRWRRGGDDVTAHGRRLDLGGVDLFQHARAAEEGAHGVRGEEAVVHVEENCVEGKRLLWMEGGGTYIEDLFHSGDAHIVSNQLHLYRRDGLQVAQRTHIDRFQRSEIVEVLNGYEGFDD